MSKHLTRAWDDEVRGYPGTKWECTCGARGDWSIQDGSAERDAHDHRMARDPEYRTAHTDRTNKPITEEPQ